MDKPISMSVKDFLIRKLAIKLLIKENIIEAVVHHQFSSANKALQDDNNNSVEIAGFGKFLYNPKKAKKKFVMLEVAKKNTEEVLKQEDLSETKRKNMESKLRDIILYMEQIKPKINV